MRMIWLAGVVSAASTVVHAGSIDAVKTNSDNIRSIDYVSCPTCAPLKTPKQREPEITLEPGTQKVELKKIDGVLKVYRTEAWLGGSPVTYVSKASTDLVTKQTAEARPVETPKDTPVTIDTSTTSAVSADMSSPDLGAEVKAKPVEVKKDTAAVESNSKPKIVQHFNPQSLELRIKVD